jgi:hypothetical protein
MSLVYKEEEGEILRLKSLPLEKREAMRGFSHLVVEF